MLTTATPRSLFQAMSDIGSLLGLTKLFIIFTLLNQWVFEKKLAAQYNREGPGEKQESIVRNHERINESELSMTATLLDQSQHSSPAKHDEQDQHLPSGQAIDEDYYYRELFSFKTFAEMHRRQLELVRVVNSQQEVIK